MKNDNDSNADLDLNLEDEFDLENSDPDLTFEDSDASQNNADAQESDDDSVELDELFGDSDDDFNFSKKEEINLAFDEQEYAEAKVETGDIAQIDIDDSGSELDSVATDQPDAESIIDAEEIQTETVDPSELADLPSKKAASVSGGFLSRILGIFRRKKDDEYGTGYSEFSEQEAVQFQRNTPFSSKNAPEGNEAQISNDELIEEDEIQANLDADAAVPTNEPSTELENDDLIDVGEVVPETVVQDESDENSREDFDDNESGVFKTIEINHDDLISDEMEDEEPISADLNVESESMSAEATNQPGDAGDYTPQIADTDFENQDELVVETSGLDEETVENDGEISEDTDSATTGGFLSRIMGLFRRKSKTESPVEESDTEQVVDEATDQHVDSDETSFDADEDEYGSDVDNDNLAAAATVVADATVPDPSEFDLSTDDDMGLTGHDTVPETEFLDQLVEPSAETVREDSDFEDELDFEDEFDFDGVDEEPLSTLNSDDEPVQPDSTVESELVPEIIDHLSDPASASVPQETDDQQVDALRDENEQLKSELEATKVKLEESRQTISANQSEMDRLSTELATFKADLEAAESQRQSLSDELERTQNSLIKAQEKSETFEATESADDWTDSEVFAKADTVDAETELAELQRQLEKETQLRHDAEQFLLEAEAQRNEVARSLRQVRTELKEAQQSAVESEIPKEITIQLEKYSQQIEGLTAERDQLLSDAKSYEGEKEQIENQVTDLQEKLTDLEKQLDDSKATNRDIESSRAQLTDQAKQSEGRIAELQRVNSDLGEELSQQNNQLQEKTDAIEELKAELAKLDSENTKTELEAAISKLAALESKLNANESMIEQKETELASLRTELESAKTAASDSEDDLAATLQLKRDLEELTAEHKQQQQHHAKLESDLLVAESELQATSDRAAELKMELSAAQNTNQQLADSLEEKTRSLGQLAQLRNEFDDARLEAEKTRQKLELETASFQSRLEAEQNLAASRADETARLISELDQLKGQLAENQSLLETERSAKSDLSRELEQLRGSLLELTAKMEATESATAVNQQLQEAMLRQERRIGELQSTHQDALDRIEALISTQKAAKTKSSKKAKSSKLADDDLTNINGIGPVLKKRLHELGITTVKQIAEWTAEDVKSWEAKLERSSISKDNWVKQAKKLSK